MSSTPLHVIVGALPPFEQGGAPAGLGRHTRPARNNARLLRARPGGAHAAAREIPPRTPAPHTRGFLFYGRPAKPGCVVCVTKETSSGGSIKDSNEDSNEGSSKGL